MDFRERLRLAIEAGQRAIDRLKWVDLELQRTGPPDPQILLCQEELTLAHIQMGCSQVYLESLRKKLD